MRSAALAVLLGTSAAALAAEPTAVAVEFHNAITGHYFMAAGADEIRSVDSGGAGPGWSRTGGEFGVFARASDAPGLAPVCRFYAPPPTNSHFYTADASECEGLRANGGGWLYEGIAFHVERPVAGSCGAGTTPVYRTYNNGFARSDSNHRFTVDATVYTRQAMAGHAPEGVAMCAALSAADRRADAVRLLRQATFGPTPAEAERAAAMGAAAWVDEQLAMPATQYPAYPWVANGRPEGCVDDRTQPVRPDSYCNRDNYTLFPLQLAFFRGALANPDQLRARVAFALSQIMVTSGLDMSRNYAMRHYQQMLYDRALGNFHDLLLAVTLSPVMGDYLDMANNNKSDAARGTDPNENYAREVLQLFSIGTFLLNADGTLQLDPATGRARPAYEQAQVKGFSRVFTGWTYPTVQGATPRNNNPRNYLGDMRPVSANHEFGTKVLLSGVVAPANLAMEEDLAFAHRNIFQHANVGPFIGRQLIQKLVTSDPSPAYVARVTAAFDDNGAGRRGDLRAVVRAILLDPEARGARKIHPGYGKLVEPVLYMTGVARAAAATTDGVFFRASSQALGQFVFYAPSVFNFYPFDYVVPATSLAGPEFGVQTSTTAINRANFANAVLFGNGIAPDPAVYAATGTQFSLSAYQALAADAAALVDRLDRDLMAGAMSAAMRSAIATAVGAIPATDTLGRARSALYLVLTSPQYQVQR